MRVRVIDYETTGFDDDANAEVIEVGYVDLDTETLQIVGWDSCMAAPEKRQIGPDTMAVHHITNREVADRGVSRPEMWSRLMNDLLDDLPKGNLVLAAHNANFEQAFTPGADMFRWICTAKCARVLWPDAPSYKNQVLRYWLGVDDLVELFDRAVAMPPHRALPDAYVTSFLLREMLRIKSVDELVEISRWPALLRDVNFGKHRGSTFKDLPSGYLEWILGADFDEDTRFTARYWLKKRKETEAA